MSSTTPDTVPPFLIEGLLDPHAYSHPTTALHVVETHISWVLLTGDFAYKIKKPVNFGFLDFSTLTRRRHYCEEELRLNRRYAPDLYLGVVPIAGTPRKPRLNGPGPAIEYAVKMRQFVESDLLEQVVRDGRLLPEQIDRLAEILAAFHARVNRAGSGDQYGLPAQIRQIIEQNFTKIRACLAESTDHGTLDELATWTKTEYRRLRIAMLRRKTAGHVRECHGDLHLGNLVLIEGCPTPFDGIEFNEDLRWIDCVSELAFPVMDLEAHGAQALAWRLLNRYLEITGDYPGLELFDFYRVYRALVRATVAQLTRQQAGSPGERQALQHRYEHYVAYARMLIRPRRPLLLIAHGLSGTGKSHLAGRLAERLPAIRIRSDVERKRLAGLAATERTRSAQGAGIYEADMTRKTYGRLAKLAKLLLNAGHSVVVDATFLSRPPRDQQRRVAEHCHADFLILDCRAPVELLKQRIRTRLLAGNDASEADLSVLETQIRRIEPPGIDERAVTLTVDTSGDDGFDDLLGKIGAHLAKTAA